MLNIRDEIAKQIAEFQGAKLRGLLRRNDLSFEDKRLIAVYLYVVEGDFVIADKLMSQLLKEYPHQSNGYITSFLINLAEGRLPRAKELLGQIPNGHHKGIGERLMSHQTSLVETPKASQGLGADQERFQSNILHTITSQDWVKLYVTCYFSCNDLHLPDTLLFQSRAYFVYSMLKLNLKSALVLELQSDYFNDFPFQREAMSNYVRYFDKKYDEIIEKSTQFIPRKLQEGDVVFYSLMFETLADSLLRAGKKEELNRLLEREIELNDEKPWSAIFLGLEAYKNDLPKALNYWRRAANGNSFCINHCWGVNSFVERNTFRFSDSLFHIENGKEALDNAETIFVACADAKYARLFSANIFKNTAQNPDVHWHYHFIIDCDDDLKDLRDALFDISNVSYSYESHVHILPKAYFTVGRFELARRFVQELDAQIIVSDIDMEALNVRRALEVAKKDNHCVGLHHAGFYYHFPWHAIQANLFYLDGSTDCLKFLDKVVEWIELHFDFNHKYQWWIDQVAVAISLRDMDVAKTVTKINGEFLKCFRFAGSSPDRKERFVSMLLKEQPEIAEKVRRIMVK